MEVIESEVIEIISQLVENPPKKIETNMSMKDEIGADDFDVMCFLIAIEDKYGFYFPDDALQKFRKLSEIVNEIKKHLDKKNNDSDKTHCRNCIDLRMYKSDKDTIRTAALR